MSQTSKPSAGAATNLWSKLKARARRQADQASEDASDGNGRRSLVPRSIAWRLILFSTLVIGLAFLVGGLVLSRLFYWHAITTTNRQLEDILSNLALDVSIEQPERSKPALVAVDRSGQETAFNSPFSGKYWQITEPSGKIHRSDSLLDFKLAVPGVVRPGDVLVDTHRGPENQTVLQRHRAVYYRDFGLVMRLSAAVDISEVRALHRSFNFYLFVSLILLGVVLVAGIFVQVTLALRPLRRAQSKLKEVRKGAATNMGSGQDYPPEIVPLVEEIDALIADNQTIVERARKQVGNLAHGLKTPLSVLQNEIEQDESDLAVTVRRQTASIQEQVQRYLALARSVAASQQRGVQTKLNEVAMPLMRTLGKIHRDKGLVLNAQIAPDLLFAGEHQDLQEMLGNLLDNACKWAHSEVQLSAKRDDKALVICVEDDGPGVAEEELANLGARGKRLDEQTPGTGLGLSIVKDLADVYKGELVFQRASLGGLAARLVFPDR